jgi:hypothetical protein
MGRGEVDLSKFLLSYIVFLMFIALVVGMMSPEEKEKFGLPVNITPPSVPPKPSVWDYISYPIAQLGFFFSLMVALPTTGWVGWLIVTPAIVLLLYLVLRLLRGGG